MRLADLIAQAGWTMVPLAACSIVALAVFLKKLFELRRLALEQLGWLDAVVSKLEGGDIEAAVGASTGPHPAANVVQVTLQTLARCPDRAEAEAQRAGSAEVQRVERHLALLAFIAQVAPLLGLLGTVLGMVDLFLGLQAAGLTNVDVALLSSGIWKALLTTAAGLAIAVPTLAAHAYLSSRADLLRLQLHDAVQRVLTAARLGAPITAVVDGARRNAV